MTETKDNTWKLRESPAFLDSEGQLQVWATIFPVHRSLPVIFYILGFIHLGMLIKTALLTFDELLILIECANFIMIVVTASVVMVLFSQPAINEKMIEMYRKMDRGLCNYDDTLDYVSLKEIEKIKTKAAKSRRTNSTFLKYLIFSVVVMLGILRPIYKYFNGEFSQNNYSKFINRNLPIAIWTPYDSTEWPGFILIIIIEYYLMLEIIFIFAGGSSQFLIFAETLTSELTILHLTLTQLIRRAKHVAKTRGQSAITKEILDSCIGKSISHHQNILAFFDMFQSSWSWIIWTACTVATFMICFNGFVCSTDEVELLAKAISAASFTVMITMMYLLCIYGETIQSLSSDIGFEMYKSEWLDYSLPLKQHILVIQTIGLKPLILYGGGLIEANLNTFGSILNSAYSYFNLLRASRQG